ncbi:hypothetical protein K431DRAFT_289677 [Polychaeton citri CBS 116435]|uniref:Uncharacterized protein n=1 Tax=Polychaeton citri CBS 116435 TaxID=1314669 RepID=A0A9P4UKB2_9PEZI|nr:hypothetical protein K431DRAFT_289677 [Polychaeton citri CBS 116435]
MAHQADRQHQCTTAYHTTPHTTHTTPRLHHAPAPLPTTHSITASDSNSEHKPREKKKKGLIRDSPDTSSPTSETPSFDSPVVVHGQSSGLWALLCV